MKQRVGVCTTISFHEYQRLYLGIKNHSLTFIWWSLQSVRWLIQWIPNAFIIDSRIDCKCFKMVLLIFPIFRISVKFKLSIFYYIIFIMLTRIVPKQCTSSNISNVWSFNNVTTTLLINVSPMNLLKYK